MSEELTQEEKRMAVIGLLWQQRVTNKSCEHLYQREQELNEEVKTVGLAYQKAFTEREQIKRALAKLATPEYIEQLRQELESD